MIETPVTSLLHVSTQNQLNDDRKTELYNKTKNRSLVCQIHIAQQCRQTDGHM